MSRTVTVHLPELELVIDGDYEPGCAASPRTLGDPSDPPEPSGFDPITVSAGGKDFPIEHKTFLCHLLTMHADLIRDQALEQIEGA